MICTLCYRNKEQIVASIENKHKATEKTVIDVLFKDNKDRLVCGRCVATLALTLKCGGKPVLTYHPKATGSKYMACKEEIKTAIKEPVVLDNDVFTPKW